MDACDVVLDSAVGIGLVVGLVAEIAERFGFAVDDWREVGLVDVVAEAAVEGSDVAVAGS